ncbi:MAG: hypothetical protein V2J12_08915 [Gammaproteobacteria bacterium]|jgi:hypothetical protein|nr:hypothetical protein [Gammaproteobacteria bacterium]
MRPGATLGYCLLAITLASTAARGGSWDNEGELSATASYSDNPGLLTELQNPQGALATVATARANLRYIDPNRETAIVPTLRQTYYPDSDFRDLNQTDYLLRVSTSTLERRITWGVDFNYDDQGILSAEDTNPDDPNDGGDANFLRADDRRERISFAPRLNLQVSPKDLLSVSVNYSTVDFELDFTDRSDFDAYGGSITYDRQLTQRQSLGFLASRNTLEATRLGRFPVCSAGELPGFLPDGSLSCVPVTVVVGDLTNDSEGTSLRLLYTFDISEQMQFNAALGRQSTDIESGIFLPNDQQVSESSFKSTEYNLGLVRSGQRYNWQFNASRSVQPSSIGQPADKIQVSGSFGYRLTERLNVEVAGVAFKQDLKSALVTRENEFLRADLTMAWRLTRNWVLTGAYTFRRQNPTVRRLDEIETPENSNLIRRSNAASLTLRYRFR